MARTESDYRGHSIVIEASERRVESIAIDGTEIAAVYEPELDGYTSLVMPHQIFDTPEALAQAVVDYLPDFAG
jgi:hypothetical protein